MSNFRTSEQLLESLRSASEQPLPVVEPVESATFLESLLASGGRFLLTFSMALFVSYMLFILGSVVVAVVASRVRGVNERFSREQPVEQSPVDVRRGGQLTIVPGAGESAAEPDAGPDAVTDRTKTVGGTP